MRSYCVKCGSSIFTSRVLLVCGSQLKFVLWWCGWQWPTSMYQNWSSEFFSSRLSLTTTHWNFIWYTTPTFISILKSMSTAGLHYYIIRWQSEEIDKETVKNIDQRIAVIIKCIGLKFAMFGQVGTNHLMCRWHWTDLHHPDHPGQFLLNQSVKKVLQLRLLHKFGVFLQKRLINKKSCLKWSMLFRLKRISKSYLS